MLSKSKNKKHEHAKVLIAQWSLLTTFHCYPKIFQDKNIVLKLIWTFIFVAFSVLTAWLVIKAMIDYFQYELTSKIQVINEKPTFFPAVTICNTNAFSSLQAQHLIEQKFKETYDVDLESLAYKDVFSKLMQVNDITRLYANSPAFTDEQRLSMGFVSYENIQLCIFNGKVCTLNWMYSYEYGNCYVFNSGVNLTGDRVRLLKTEIEGGKNGLRMLIGPVTNENKYPNLFSNGLKVFIHNQSFLPRSSDGVDIEMGKETSIAIQRTFTSNQPEPYSECVDNQRIDSFREEYTKFSNQTYRQQDCLDLCLQKLIISVCKCYFTGLSAINRIDVAPCLNLSQLNCINEQNVNFIEMSKEDCDVKCPLECESISYDLSVSSLVYPSKQLFNLFINDETALKHYRKLSNENVTYERLREQYLALNVFYLSTKYTLISQVPKASIVDLISNMGGALGIFLGFSIFSMIELVEIVCRIFHVYFVL